MDTLKCFFYRLLAFKQLKYNVAAYLVGPLGFVYLASDELKEVTAAAGELFGVAKVFTFTSWIMVFTNFFLYILIIQFICQDFNFRTIRKRLMCGMSRKQIFVDIVLIMLFCSLLANIEFFILASVFIVDNFADAFTTQNIRVLLGFNLNIMLSFAFAGGIAFFVGKSGAAILTLFSWKLFAAPMLRMFLKNNFDPEVYKKMPNVVADTVIGPLRTLVDPQVQYAATAFDFSLAGLYLFLFFAVIYWRALRFDY